MQLLFHGSGYYYPSKLIGPAVWPHHDVIVALNGRIKIEIHGRAFIFEEGDALLIPPNHSFQGFAETETATIWVLHFKEYHAQSRSSPFCSQDPLVISKACGGRLEKLLLTEFSRAWQADESFPKGRETTLMGELILLKMEQAFFQPKQTEPPRLRAAIEETLNGNFGNDVADMACLAGVCPSRFRQLFGKHYGISPIEFLRRARMQEAKRLLSETARPIKEIGRLVGYGELAAFHRAFHREVHMTPAVYRKRHGDVA